MFFKKKSVEEVEPISVLEEVEPISVLEEIEKSNISPFDVKGVGGWEKFSAPGMEEAREKLAASTIENEPEGLFERCLSVFEYYISGRGLGLSVLSYNNADGKEVRFDIGSKSDCHELIEKILKHHPNKGIAKASLSQSYSVGVPEGYPEVFWESLMMDQENIRLVIDSRPWSSSFRVLSYETPKFNNSREFEEYLASKGHMIQRKCDDTNPLVNAPVSCSMDSCKYI